MLEKFIWVKVQTLTLTLIITAPKTQYLAKPLLARVPPNIYLNDTNSYLKGQSRTAIAEQLPREKRTQGPIELIKEYNPYLDHYMAKEVNRRVSHTNVFTRDPQTTDVHV